MHAQTNTHGDGAHLHIRMRIMEGEKEDRMEGRREEKRERDRQMRQTDEHTDTHTHIEERQRWGKKERISLNFPFFSCASKIYLQTAQYNLSQLQCKAI